MSTLHELPPIFHVGPHRKWIAISNVGGAPARDGWPILGYAMVHATRPIPNISLGFSVATDSWIMSVQGFNDSDDLNTPEPIGTFGYVNVWPAIKPVYHPKHSYTIVADEVHESDYENARAFETFPTCPFYTSEHLTWIRNAPNNLGSSVKGVL